MANTSNCSFYAADTKYEIVAALRAATGIISAICCLVVIIVTVKDSFSTFLLLHCCTHYHILLLESTTIRPGHSLMTTATLEVSSISTPAGLRFWPCLA